MVKRKLRTLASQKITRKLKKELNASNSIPKDGAFKIFNKVFGKFCPRCKLSFKKVIFYQAFKLKDVRILPKHQIKLNK